MLGVKTRLSTFLVHQRARGLPNDIDGREEAFRKRLAEDQ
jgi:hypothetical protein